MKFSHKRRGFLKTLAAGAAGSFLAPLSVLAANETRVVILHTNDTHSRIDPFPMDGSRNQGLGGVARRSTLIKRIRASNPNVLLLDSGDVFQGTPYFNFFKGEVEFKAMSAMGYDVSTIGNHDFDNGVAGFVDMQPYAEFEWVCANYDASESAMARYIKPFTIRDVGGIRVGIFGLGIDFERLVLPELHKGVEYNDPYFAAEKMTNALRDRGCNVVICLSHLGHRYRADIPSDVALANELSGIDLILGGHTHTFLDEPEIVTRASGITTVVHQVGFAGIRLGRIDLVFDSDGRINRWYASSYDVDARIDDLA